MSRSTQSRLHLRRPTWRGWFVIALISVLVIIVALWAIDYATLENRVARNVTVEDVHLGRLSGPALERALERADTEYGSGTVNFVVDGKVYPMSAGDIGLHLDVPATLAGARDVARDDPAVLRPVTWLVSWFSPRHAPVLVTLDKQKLATALATLPGQTPVVEPRVVGSVDAIGTTAGRDGFAFDPDEVARLITAAARTGTLPLRIPLAAQDIEPTISESEITKLAGRARALTAKGIELKVKDRTMTASPSLLRTWITSDLAPGAEHAKLAMRPKPLLRSVRSQLGKTLVKPVPATFTVEGSQVLLVPQVDGEDCCALSTGKVILDALRDGKDEVGLPLVKHPPDFTTADARKLGITTLLGADLSAEEQRLWQKPKPRTPPAGDAPVSPPSTTVPATTTTTTTTTPDDGATGGAGQFIVPIPNRRGQSANVDQAIEDLRGRIIRPGKQLSLNQVLGPPSPENDYVRADVATPDGPTWVSGGGTDLVAAALFEAAYTSGMDIPTSTPHGVLPKGVQPGIEATLGWTEPDLVIRNPSTDAVLVWVDRVRDGVRVQLFGTPFTKSVTTAPRQRRSGPRDACLNVVVVRTRKFSDGDSKTDTFRARYTPEPGARDDPDRVVCPT